MTTTIRLTAAQAMVKWFSMQRTEEGHRFIEGVWAIFGHGNVAPRRRHTTTRKRAATTSSISAANPG